MTSYGKVLTLRLIQERQIGVVGNIRTRVEDFHKIHSHRLHTLHGHSCFLRCRDCNGPWKPGFSAAQLWTTGGDTRPQSLTVLNLRAPLQNQVYKIASHLANSRNAIREIEWEHRLILFAEVGHRTFYRPSHVNVHVPESRNQILACGVHYLRGWWDLRLRGIFYFQNSIA